MTELNLYAIRHTSGNYLSDKWPGSSFWEGEAYKGTPKLFKSIGSAKGWRTQWLKGRLVKETYQSSYESFYEDEVSYTYEEIPERRIEHIQIIPVTLVLGEPL